MKALPKWQSFIGTIIGYLTSTISLGMKEPPAVMRNNASTLERMAQHAVFRLLNKREKSPIVKIGKVFGRENVEGLLGILGSHDILQ